MFGLLGVFEVTTCRNNLITLRDEVEILFSFFHMKNDRFRSSGSTLQLRMESKNIKGKDKIITCEKEF